MKSPLVSDAKLIANCLSGDVRSWDALIARYQGFIFGLALRMGLSSADAEEVFQNVCLKMFQNLGDLRDTARLSSWLASIVRQEVWRLGRQRATASLNDLALDEGWNPESVQPIGSEATLSPEETLLAAEEQHLVRQCLRDLPEECRKLLTLLYQGDPPCSYAEVAQTLSIPLGSIGPKRARCLMRLKKMLEEFGF